MSAHADSSFFPSFIISMSLQAALFQLQQKIKASFEGWNNIT